MASATKSSMRRSSTSPGCLAPSSSSSYGLRTTSYCCLLKELETCVDQIGGLGRAGMPLRLVGNMNDITMEVPTDDSATDDEPQRPAPPPPHARSRSPLTRRSRTSGNRKRCRQTGSRPSTPIRKFSIGPGIHTNLENPAEFSPKGKLIRNFSIDPTSSIRTRLWTPFLRTPFPRLLELEGNQEDGV